MCIIPGIKKQGDIVDVFFPFCVEQQRRGELQSPSGAEDRERMRRDDRLQK